MPKKGSKINVSPEGHKVRSEHGRKVLQEWKAENPDQGKATHGASSDTVRKRFDDLRTIEGRALAEAVSALVDHFGGPANISSPMSLLLDSNIRPKLITLMCINNYINTQESLINASGELIPCLSKSYIAFSNALRRDLQALLEMSRDDGIKPKVPTIEDIIQGGKQ